MLEARRVVYTAIVGGKDRLRDPLYQLPDVDYICFSDDSTLRSKVYDIRPLPWQEASPRLSARRIKLLPHLLFPEHGQSLWIDGSICIRADITMLWEMALAEHKMAALRHPHRQCLYQEAETCARLGREKPDRLANQAEAYRLAGMPSDAGLFETSILFRTHHAPVVVGAMEGWWQEVHERSERDQVSLPYVLWRQNLDCEALSYANWHDACFLHYPHRWHPSGDDRNAWHARLHAWLHVWRRKMMPADKVAGHA